MLALPRLVDRIHYTIFTGYRPGGDPQEHPRSPLDLGVAPQTAPQIATRRSTPDRSRHPIRHKRSHEHPHTSLAANLRIAIRTALAASWPRDVLTMATLCLKLASAPCISTRPPKQPQRTTAKMAHEQGLQSPMHKIPKIAKR